MWWNWVLTGWVPPNKNWLPMPRIDAHQHFWEYNAVRDAWITEEMGAIRRNFLPADLQPLLHQHGFDGCVVVQSDQSAEHTRWLLSLAEQASFIKGIVGWVDLQAADIREQLAYYSQFPAIKGFRHVLQGEEDRALMLRPAFTAGITALATFGYTYDILIFPDQLCFAAELAGRFPNQPFVVDHIAKPYIRTGEISGWEKDIRALAEHPNVYCKVSGMVTEADWQHWKKEQFTPYLDVVTEAFGVQRLLYGSDWPVCLVAASYASMLDIATSYYSRFSQAEQEAVFGGNAASFYKLN
jgi:L-fuconolactonase